jgi:hypothetical protein
VIKNTRFCLFTLLVFCACNASAARLSLADQSGKAFVYNKTNNYATISLKELNLPSIEDDSSKLASFFKKIFVNRKRYGIAYIEVTPPFKKPEKTILFSFEREDADRYKFKYIGTSSDITYQVSQPFIYSDPVNVNIVIKEWEDEKTSSAVKTILSAAGSSNLAVSYGNLLSNITLMLDLVEALFPADSTEEALSLRLNPNDINKQDIQINGDDANFFKLVLRSEDSFFQDFDTEKGLQRAGIKNTQIWKQVISAADKNLNLDGLEPLVAVVQSYADYVSTLTINRKDQAILTACSINDWANNAVTGDAIFENKRVQFTAHDYSKLTTANLKIVRGSDCDFKGVICRTSNCLAMSDFINKSSRKAAREIASELYIDGELTITFKDTERTLTPAEYISLFRISRPAFFDSEPTGPNSWSYYFDENKLDLRIDGNRYMPYKIRIDLVKEQVSEVDKFLIVGIEIEADILSAEVQ